MGSTPANDIPLGTVLGGTYEISGVLGRGGMGTVFLAKHLRLPGKQVAIKVLRHDGSLGKEVFLRFRREAEIATRLGHPNIVEVLDFNSLEDGSPFLVMEHLRGMPLSRRMRKGPRLTLQEVFSIARQMGSALQAAHQAGVVHRDIKPGNVFLVPTEVAGLNVEHVKLLDFGISKIIDSQTVRTQDAILLGTPQYMAPEQALGKNTEVDSRTDIFCFGVLVYEMLARKLPFKDGGVLSELVYRIVYEPPEPLLEAAPDTPLHVVQAIEKALAKRPESRFGQVAEFVAALTGSPLRTATPSPDAPVSHPATSGAPQTASVQPRPIASRLSKPPTVPAKPPASRNAPVPVASPVVTSAPLSGRSARVVPGGMQPGMARGLEASALVPFEPPASEAPAASASPALPSAAEHDIEDDEGAASEAATIQSATPPEGSRRVRARRWGVIALVASVVLIAGGMAMWGRGAPRRVAEPSTPLGDARPVEARAASPEKAERGGASGVNVAPKAKPEGTPGVDAAPQAKPEGGQGADLLGARMTESQSAPSEGTPGPAAPGTHDAKVAGLGSPGTDASEAVGAREAQSPRAADGTRSPDADAVSPPTALSSPEVKTPTAQGRTTAREDFVAAEHALARGDAAGALALIQRARQSSQSPWAFSLLTRAHCLLGAEADARTAWTRVPSVERSRVRKFCQRHDISL
ncbi:protein kinase [Myxococcus stipitatus]|uniref:serine/threonine-protein kinase n=1 Tax=Myxococcus stipitatus TaxID=83455 RepID=UPI001F44C8C5|nr:serine/threonine-protein kinase [Myxococcus stipitatus]MCE9673140.1 protein kinase [Myxococcus stipitatus]